jgi:cytoskeleton protein RodZ
MSLGERFRTAREQRGLTLSEVAEHLRIRSLYLAAIEDENWSAIGAPVYARGFLRTYARYLQIDAEEAVAEYNRAVPSSPLQASLPRYSRAGREPGGLRPLLWIAGVVALGLVAFVVYLSVAPPRAAQPLAQAPASSLAAARSPGAALDASAAVLPTARPGHLLAIHLTAPSWLRVSVDGDVKMEGTFPAGTSKTFRGRSALVRVGNAGGVQVVVDGKPLGALGGKGDVVEKSFSL